MSVTLALEIRPLSAVMGAEIRGLDLRRPLSRAILGELADAFLQYHVLTFREQQLTAEQQLAFARAWGTPHVHVLDQYQEPGTPEALLLSNLDAHGNPRSEHPDPAAQLWHSDGSWSLPRPLATCVYGLVLPRQGGDTLFADAGKAWETLPAELKRRIEGRNAVHDLDWSRRQIVSHPQLTARQRQAAPPVEQPMVRTIPETGQRVIYLGQHAAQVAGMDPAEGQALIRTVNAHITLPENQFAYRWRPGDLVMWDNRCVLHCATDFDWRREERTLRRVTVVGERVPA